MSDAILAPDVDQDSGLASLALVLGFHQIPAAPAQMRHALGHGRLAEETDLLVMARRLGAKAKSMQPRSTDLGDVPLPAIAQGRDGGFFVVAAARDGELLIQVPGRAPERLPANELGGRWTGRLIIVATRNAQAAATRFDVTWFIPALVKYRWMLGDVLLASLVLQLFALGTPLIFQVVIDKVLVHQGLTTLDVLAIGLVSIIVFESILGALRSYVFTHTTSRVDVELGAKLYRHLLNLPLSYFESRRVGDTIARVRELETIREFLTSSSVTLFVDLLFTIIFLVVMWFYSPYLLLVVLVTIVLYALICGFITPPLRRRIEERFQRNAESQAFLVESVTGVQTLKAAAVEPQMQTRWENLLSAYVKSSFRAAQLNIWGGQGIQLVSKLSTAVILYVGAKLAIGGSITVGELVAFNMLAGRVSEPVLRLAGLWQQFQEARVGVDRLGDVLNAPTESQFSASRAVMPAIQGAIELKDIMFRYQPGGREVLRRVSLQVAPGEVLGIVGPSGSGKSTLTKLIQRLYVPESGRVLVDGADLAMVDPAWLRRQVGVVLQENLLFNRSVRENIALADPGMSMERVIAAATLAGAHEFILELPEAYDSLIEERGANLSGGQRQRLAIARALVTNPRILILDEATSALDAESEAIIHHNMRAIAQGRTVLIIAHRLSAIRMANRIITMEAGEITETGTHAELLARGGRYSQLYNTQMHGARQ